MTQCVYGWWFSTYKKLPHNDLRPIEIGITHKVEGKIVPCHNGLHLSERPIDALLYAPGPLVWKVRGSGTIVPHNNDKYACSERTYLAGGIDVSYILDTFARKCALDVVDLWDAPEVVISYLKTGDMSMRTAAKSAHWYAAEYAAWYAAKYAAKSAQNERLTEMLNAVIG